MDAKEINALPQRVRDYIMFLETEADPAGTIATNFRLTNENAELRRLIINSEAEFHKRLRTLVTRRQQGYIMGAFREALGLEK